MTQDLLARGMTFSPRPFFGNFLGGRRDLSFGIYGRADEARKLLDEKWSGMRLRVLRLLALDWQRPWPQ